MSTEPTTSDEILNIMRAPGEDLVYILGSLARRITVYSQQQRALNLIWALSESHRISPGSVVGIVGGGAAGITAAAGALSLGCKVHLLESKDSILHLQRGVETRYLHPNIYDWPEAHSGNPKTDLPFLNWSAANADRVVAQLEREWNIIRKDANLELKLGTRVDLPIGRLNKKRVINCNGKYGFKQIVCDVLIFAIGFGLDRPFGGVKPTPYWSTNELHEPVKGTNIVKRYLVSGCGDGGLVDVLRLRIADFKHSTIAAKFDNRGLESIKNELLQIERDAYELGPDDDVSVYLLSRYERLSFPRRTKKLVGDGLRRDTHVVLNGSGQSPLSLRASILNRLALFLLLDNSGLEYKAGNLKPENIILANGRYKVKLGSEPEDEYDHVVIRHGPDPTIDSFFSGLVPWRYDTNDPTRAPQWSDNDYFPIRWHTLVSKLRQVERNRQNALTGDDNKSNVNYLHLQQLHPHDASYQPTFEGIEVKTVASQIRPSTDAQRAAQAALDSTSLVGVTAPLDQQTRALLARAFFESFGSTIERIELASVGGEGPVRSVDIDQLYISLIADPTHLDEWRSAAENAGESRRTRDDLAADVQRSSLQPGVIERIRRDEIPGSNKHDATRRHNEAIQNSDCSTLDIVDDGELLDDVVRRERYCMILGEPGSGKSVLCRWLTHELSKAWTSDKPSQRLGFLLFPIFIVLRDLAQRVEAGTCNSIENYILQTCRPVLTGMHERDWDAFIAEVLQDGTAFVILDGIDEVPSTYQVLIRRMIEEFTQTWITSTASSLEQPNSGAGNRILITSRIIGYYPVRLASFAHFIIRPMTDPLIIRFCNNWCEASQRTEYSAQLISAIFDPAHTSIRSLATNPLLLSILCQLAMKKPREGISLPRIRAELYEKVVYEAAEQWRSSAHDYLRGQQPYFTPLLSGVDNVLVLFAPLAEHIHENSVSGEVEAERLLRFLVQSMAWLEGKLSSALDGAEWQQRKQYLMDALRLVVGVISERANGTFSFLHRTFQEYLSGIALLLVDAEDHQKGAPVFSISAEALADRIISKGRLTDSRWRQSILLLCGQLAWMEVSTFTGKPRIAPRLSDLLQLLEDRQTAGTTGLLDEQYTTLLADILTELPDEMLHSDGWSSKSVGLTVARLLDTYARFLQAGERRFGDRVYGERMAGIRRRLGIINFEGVLFKACKLEDARNRIGPAADLMLSRGWITQSAVDFFSNNLLFDEVGWGWAAHRLVRQSATIEPIVKVLAPVESFVVPISTSELRRYRESVTEWNRLRTAYSERVRIESPIRPSGTSVVNAALEDELLQTALSDPTIALLAIAILGGLGDYNARCRSDDYQEYSRFLQKADHEREAELDAEQWRYVPIFGANDTVYALAVHLDKTAAEYYYPEIAPSWRTSHIVRADRLAVICAKALRTPKTFATDIVAARSDGFYSSEIKAVSLIGGLSAGPSIVDDATTFTNERVIWHLSRIQDEMSDACFRGIPYVKSWLTQQATGSTSEERYILDKWLAKCWALLGSSIELIKTTNAQYTEFVHTSRVGIADFFGKCIRGFGDEIRYNLAVAIETQWGAVTPQEHQLQLYEIVTSPSIAVLDLELPGLLALGTGKTALAPLAFYDTVIQLQLLIAEKMHDDLSQGWTSRVLKQLISLDPLAAECSTFYAPVETGEPIDGRFNNLRPEVAAWRSLMTAHLLPGKPNQAEFDHQLAKWRLAWGAVEDQEHKLILARDASQTGLGAVSEVTVLIRSLLLELHTDWCVEGALLAGYLAQESAADQGRQWLRIGIDCLDQAGGDMWKAEALNALTKVARSMSDENELKRLLEIKATLSPMYQSVADGCTSRWVQIWASQHWPTDAVSQASLTATLLHSRCHEEIAANVIEMEEGWSVTSLWKDLANAILQRETVKHVRTLTTRLVDLTGTRSLVLTDAAGQAMEAALIEPELAHRGGFLRLLPLLERPSAKTLAFLKRWLKDDHPGVSVHRFSQEMLRHAVLWIDEVERPFTPSDIQALRSLAMASDDRVRARVLLMLHGPEVWLGNRPARFSLSNLRSSGAKGTMETLGEAARREKGSERYAAVSKASLYEWTIDDTDILECWLTSLAQDPKNEALLLTVFCPWRWSQDCLELWTRWISAYRHPELIKASAEWLGVILVANKFDSKFSNIPDIPHWFQDQLDISWLPKESILRLTESAVFNGVSENASLVLAAKDANRILSQECIRTQYVVYTAASFRAALTSYGDSISHLIGETPESASVNIPAKPWSTEHVKCLMLWIWRTLNDWHRLRPDHDPVLSSICVSQLCITTRLTDWPNAILDGANLSVSNRADGDLDSWATLLFDVIRYFEDTRMVQAAWILLPYVVAPGSPVQGLIAALRCSMRDYPIVRARALDTISSSGGKALIVGLTSAEITEILEIIPVESSGQTILAIAKLLTSVLSTHSLEPSVRQEIHRHLREISMEADSHRMLFQIAGTGSRDQSGFRIVSGRFLDDELRELELNILTQSSTEL